MIRGIREDVLEQGLSPGVDAERGQIGRARRAAQQGALAERAHDDDAEPELLGERQDAALDLALARVVRDLDRGDAAAAHHVLELVERRRAVVRRADLADLALVAQQLEQVEPLVRRERGCGPGRGRRAAVELDRALGLAARLGVVGRPQLGGHERLVAARAEALRQRSLGLAVHRRGVDERGAGVEGGGDDVVASFRDVERLPRAHPDDRDLRSAGSELYAAAMAAPSRAAPSCSSATVAVAKETRSVLGSGSPA